MISKARTVDAFLAGLDPVDRAVFRKVRALFMSTGAKVEESMKYGMPTYLIGANNVGAFNRQKHYLCVYATPAAVDPHRPKLKALGLDCGKSCLRFTQPEQLPLGLLRKIITEAARLAQG